MGDDEEVLSSNLPEDVNEQTSVEDKSVDAELNNVDLFPSSDVSLESTLEFKPVAAVSVERNSDAGDVKETAIEARNDFTEKMDEAFLVEGGEEVLSKPVDSGDELMEHAVILESEKEDLSGEGVAKKSNDEMGDEQVVEEETPSINADLEMSTVVAGPMTTSAVSLDHVSASDFATSNQDANTYFDSLDLLDTAKGVGENKSSDMQVTINESELEVADVDNLEVAGVVDKLDVSRVVDKLDVSGVVDKMDVSGVVDKMDVSGVVDKLEVAVVVKSGSSEVLEVAESDKWAISEVLEVAVDGMTGSVAVEEHEPLTRSKDMQITAMESLEEDGHQKALVDPVEPSLALEGAENAVESAAGDLKIPVTAPNVTEIGVAVLPVGLKDAEPDVTVATGTEVDADTAVEVADVIKEEQVAGIEDFAVLGSESIRVITEVGHDRRCFEGEIVIGDSVKVDEMMESDPSKDLEIPGLVLGVDEPVVALRTEDEEDKMEEAGVTMEDPQAIKENKMEIDDGIEDEESAGKSHSLEVVADVQENEEILTGEETGSADTEFVTEADVGKSVKATDTDMETETYAGDSGKEVGGKRKKGKISGNSKLASRAYKATDEDVCFICFDGGDLFICDRRGCGKAYHPSCVDRDEAFFLAKGLWNCGWHLCSKCGKNAHYMCYTCTFSLCKACIRDAVILCVRGNKGFCETCMRTVLLIENHDNSHGDGKIDFDDKSSWEFLFKDYYTDLKSKHSLSYAEISAAKNPCKRSERVTVKEDSPVGVNSNEGSGSDNHAEIQEASKPKRRKDKKRLRTRAKSRVSSSSVASIPDDDEGISGPDRTDWASKELLEFVMHMRDGDRSPVSQFDVQALLLEYIKTNKLRDPRRTSQIICDSRLGKLFGKPHVGHFEMLKLLESHFLVKDDAQADDAQGSVVDTEAIHSEANENVETTPTKGIKDKKRKLHKKGIGRGPQYSRYEFAAIDMHNISLIYLRRKLMEDLLDDTDEFSNKVVGTFVRIRISGSVQKQDLYRLVLVVGTSKAAEPYKMGKRTTNTMLEILNLNKTEIVSIDSVSNQDFTEEECNRLRQSIKCGLLNRMTVGDILDKAMELQEARVNDWFESEIMRLSHLRDRASDLGRKKQLRECVEKLQILKNPEERLRRLEEVPQVHSDPNMDPNHESEDDDSEHEDTRQVFMKTNSSGFTRRVGGTEFSPRDSWNGSKFSTSFSNKNLSKGEDYNHGNDKDTSSRNLRRDREVEDDHLSKLSSPTQPNNVSRSSLPMVRSDKFVAVGSVDSPLSVSSKHQQLGVSVVGPITPPTPVNKASEVVKVNETQKTWHYKDPSGKVQGPFSIVQLRKWNNNGYFPVDLRIWKAGDMEDYSVLLTDALAGRFPEVSPVEEAKHSNLSSPTPNRGNNVVEHSNLSSPTPNRGNNVVVVVGRKEEEELAAGGGATLYSNIIAQSPSLGYSNPSSLGPISTQNSVEQVIIRGPEVDLRNHRPSGELYTEKQSDLPAGTALPIQGDTHGVPVTPVGINSTFQNPNASFSDSGLVLPQPENWRPPPMQVDQSNNNNMQPMPPNLSWGPGNQNIGWGPPPTMQGGAMNGGWVGPLPPPPPPPPPANMNWGAANANPGWGGMANMNLAFTVPNMGNMNPGWFGPPNGNMVNVPGLMPGIVTSNWVPPVANMVSGAQQPQQQPVHGNGWAMPPSGNPGGVPPPLPPAQGSAAPGYSNQYSSEMNQGYQGGGGGGGYGSSSSFGRGGGGGGSSRPRWETMCPYNNNGRCRKGARCDFRHA